MTGARIAALAMYDFAGLRAANEAFWAALSEQLRAMGETDVPRLLTRDVAHDAIWRDPRLLFGQACQYPLSLFASAPPRLVAVPTYAAPGCERGRYVSAIVVRANDPVQSLLDLRGRRCVFNERASNSGYNLLRVALVRAGVRGRFFATASASGSHLESARAVTAGTADVAALDCVSFAHIQRVHPDSVRQLRVLAWTPSSPGLPFVTAATASGATLERLRSALGAVMADPALRQMRAGLLLEGVNFDVDESYEEVRALAAETGAGGYAEIA